MHFLIENDYFAFLNPPKSIQAMYAVHLRPTGKPVAT